METNEENIDNIEENTQKTNGNKPSYNHKDLLKKKDEIILSLNGYTYSSALFILEAAKNELGSACYLILASSSVINS